MKRILESIERKTVRQVLGLMSFAVLILLINAYFNFTSRHNFPMGVMCLFTTLEIVLLGVYLGTFRNHRRAYRIGLVILTVHLLFYQILGADREIALAWILILPIISFYIGGVKGGAVYSVLLSGFIILIYTTNHMRGVYPSVSGGAYVEGAVVFSVIFIMTLIFARSSQAKEDKIFSQHFFDELTSLPNRRKLISDIGQNIDNTLILVNIDDFKEINNFVGIMGGDIVLKEVSLRYRDHLESSEFGLYKLHADEFALLLPGKRDINAAAGLAHEIHKIMDTDIEFGHTDLIVSVSIGISDDIDLLTTADIALKSSKKQKLSHVVYNSGMAEARRYEENISQLYKIQKGIENDAFIPFFQPICNLTTGQVRKYECLIRLKDEAEVILPSQFIDISKRSKKYHHLTRTMVTKSFEYFRNRDCDFSLNLCLEDLENPATTGHIYSELEKSGIGKRVIFEFLESERIEDNPDVSRFIERIREYGCRTAIDDFGSGYSNFDFILRMKFDFLKIDATLIRNVCRDSHAQIIISTIVSFSRHMGIRTIAEFVYDEETFLKVRELGVDFAQGFFIGKPEESLQEREPLPV